MAQPLGDQIAFMASDTKTATFNTSSFGSDQYKEAIIVVKVTAKSGTTPTLVPEVQVSVDGTNWVHRQTIIDEEDTASYVDLTRTSAPTNEGKIGAVGTYQCQITGNLGQFIRVACTIGGTTPSFTFQIDGWLK